jgi:PKD repeat protein
MPTDQQQNPNPPTGDNPGSTVYQLQAYIDLSRNEGDAPLPVNMKAVVKGGKAPYYYRWDVNGDGAWDYGGTNFPEIGIHYASKGTYKILLEVEDADEQFFQAHSQVYVRPSGPSSMPAVWPPIGNAPLSVALNGTGSYDLDGYIVLYEWDYTSDGVYEYSSATKPNTLVEYANVGTYNATLRVTDDDGLQDTASLQIIVQ